MENQLLNLLNGRRGHFRLESGYHSGLWLDLDPLFVRPARIRPFVETLAERLRVHGVEAICGPLVGGAFLAQALASILDVEFCYAERFAPATQNTGTLFQVEYRVPVGIGGLMRGKAVAVVDDAISAGSAVRGTLASLQATSAKPVAIAALLVMGDQAAGFCREHDLPLEYIARVPYQVWLPEECPLCASGVVLGDTGA